MALVNKVKDGFFYVKNTEYEVDEAHTSVTFLQLMWAHFSELSVKQQVFIIDKTEPHIV